MPVPCNPILFTCFTIEKQDFPGGTPLCESKAVVVRSFTRLLLGGGCRQLCSVLEG